MVTIVSTSSALFFFEAFFFAGVLTVVSVSSSVFTSGFTAVAVAAPSFFGEEFLGVLGVFVFKVSSLTFSFPTPVFTSEVTSPVFNFNCLPSLP